MNPKIRVAVVYGGRSTEHGVSTVSAGSVLGALDPDKYDVVTVGITRAGKWVLTEVDAAQLTITSDGLPAVGTGAGVVLPPDPTGSALLRTAAGPDLGGVDVVFPVLHGRFGEDGTIQGLLEMAGIPYVGAGVLASAAGMDKAITKKLLAADGLAVGRYLVVRRAEAPDPALVDALGYPVFVKPARAGSSIGITKVRAGAELADALAEAFAHDDKVLIEAGVTGREIECGVLQHPDGRVEASLPAEIRLVGSHDWYDFEAKYLDDACEFDIPAKLDDDVTAALQDLAVRAFRALEGSGLARVDFFVTEDGEAIVNEVNTMPGFTPISMYPRMFAASGVPYPQLLDTLIQTAMARFGR
jgi:D-alanine-D-alanine ligase